MEQVFYTEPTPDEDRFCQYHRYLQKLAARADSASNIFCHEVTEMKSLMKNLLAALLLLSLMHCAQKDDSLITRFAAAIGLDVPSGSTSETTPPTTPTTPTDGSMTVKHGMQCDGLTYRGACVRFEKYHAPEPARIANMADGFAVTNSAQKEIYLYKADGSIYNIINANKRITGIAVHLNTIYVGNRTDKRIDAYLTNGVLQKSFGTVSFPNDMVVANNKLYVTDTSANKVLVYDLDGNLQTTWTGFNAPTCIDYNPITSEIMVCDYLDRRVEFYGLDGLFKRYIETVPKQGMMGRPQSAPQGVDVDSDGRIYVVDALWARVYVFLPGSGIPLKTIGEYGTGPGQLNNPIDILVKDGNLLVTNSWNKRIEVLSP